MQQVMVTIHKGDGEPVTAPIAVWVGALIATLPIEWKDEVVQSAEAYIGQMSSRIEQRPRILTPGQK